MKKILIVEDETDLREALKTKLVGDGYSVEAVETSETGLQSILTNKPDLIFLDVMTHSLHAEVFLQRLRELPKGQNDSKVIVLTNLDNDITRKKVLGYGIEAYLIKSGTSLEQVSTKTKEVLGE